MFSAANRVAAADRARPSRSSQPLAQALGDPKFAADIKGSPETCTTCSTRSCTATARCTASSTTTSEADQLDDAARALEAPRRTSTRRWPTSRT